MVKVSETSLNVVLVGSCHEVPVNCVHCDGVNAAVAPLGRPVRVRTAVVGKVVPVVGVTAIV
jgi:hypothetical protein